MTPDPAQCLLRPAGEFLIKIFQDEGFGSYLKLERENFDKVVMRTSSASQDRLHEQYLLVRGLKVTRSQMQRQTLLKVSAKVRRATDLIKGYRRPLLSVSVV
ncbi:MULTISPECIES: SAM-dependent methyltransferase [unclassified Pseudomonas]|uniref:SAM-dependent methyltransferase n=1 Tax=unclassified Pseudomonas TaxID=196821 RepID=UPI00289FFF05|nr:SAM-dependent methyltransferase [Pseudomonas sp.]